MKNNFILCSHLKKAALFKGGMLLEALVAILVIAVGILGLIGLQSRALGYVDESGYRSNAVYLAGAYAAELWAVGAAGVNEDDDRYSDQATAPDSPYGKFKQRVINELPRAEKAGEIAGGGNPVVDIQALPEGGTSVAIEIRWLMPSDPDDDETAVHRYRQVTVLGFNPNSSSTP